MFHELAGLDTVQVEVCAGFGFVRSFGGDEDEVALTHEQHDLVNRPRPGQHGKVLLEGRHPVPGAGLVADLMIARHVTTDLVALPADVHGFVMVPHHGLHPGRVLCAVGLGRPVGLGAPALVRRSGGRGEAPMLDEKTVLKPEDGEEHLAPVAGIVPSMGHDEGPVGKQPDDLQAACRPAGLLAQFIGAVRNGWIVLDKPIRP